MRSRRVGRHGVGLAATANVSAAAATLPHLGGLRAGPRELMPCESPTCCANAIPTSGAARSRPCCDGERFSRSRDPASPRRPSSRPAGVDAMRIAHLLRKCDPAEWGGTESALLRLLEGSRGHGVASVVFCPRVDAAPERGVHAAARFERGEASETPGNSFATDAKRRERHAPGSSWRNGLSLKDPFVAAGWPVRRFRAWVPVWGMTEEQRRQFIAVGGNLLLSEE